MKIEQYLPMYIGQRARMLYPKKQEWKEFFVTPEFLFQHEQLQWETKLILRPLSSMTEEEHTEVSKLVMLSANPFWIQSISEVTLWYLQRGFDIFGLKEKGLCLYPEEL